MPFHFLKNTAFVLLGSVTLGLSAANIGTTTLDNGATVLLHDDYTWEYIGIKTDTTDKANTALPTNIVNSSVISAAIAEQTSTDKSSLLRSGLLNTAVKNDVKVTFSDSVWRDQSLGLKFMLSSDNTDGVVVVNVAVSFYDDNANKIPETYLRKGEPRDSRVIWIDGIDKANWTKKLLSLKVIEVETR
jgi:hypothetical protein